MKKLLSALVVLVAMSISVKAEDKIFFNLGSLNVYVPFTSVSIVGLWDGVSKAGLAGAETPLASWKSLKLVGGAVTTVENDAAGTPFLGIHIDVINPAENYIPLAAFRPGIFAGRNFRTNEWLLGLKASVGLF